MELEVPIGIDARGVDRELCHAFALLVRSAARDAPAARQVCTWPASCLNVTTTNSAGFSGAKPTMTLTWPRLMSFWVVVGSRSRRNKRPRPSALEGALAEQTVHEGPGGEPDLGPQRLVVRLEHRELQAAVEALLEEQREPADGHVFIIVLARIIEAGEGARPPDDAAAGEVADDVDRLRVELPVLRIGDFPGNSRTPMIVASKPAGAFHTPREPSIRAATPATDPAGSTVRSCPVSGSGIRSRGQATMAWSPTTPIRRLPMPVGPDVAVCAEIQVSGGSMMRKARSSRQ